MIGVLRRPGGWGLPAAIAVVAGLVGTGLAIAVLALQTKFTVALIGILVVVLAAVVSGRPRQVLLGMSILLLPLNVETNFNYNAHLGGAPGLVVTAQMALLVPLFALALIEKAVQTGNPSLATARVQGHIRLGMAAIIVPLIPLIASVPSMISADEVMLGRYELVRLFAFYLIYLYVALTFRPGDLQLILGAIFLGILMQIPIAALEYVKPDFHPQIFGQASGATQEALGATGLAVSRVSGTLTHPNELGSYLILLLPLALLCGLAKAAGFRLRVLAWFAFIGGMAMLTFTFSRASWVGILVGVPFALIIAAFYRQIRAGQAVFLLATGALAAGVIVLSPPVLSRLTESDPVNVTFRLEIAQVAINMWQSQPLVGVGLNSFSEHAQRFDVDHIALISTGQFSAVPPPGFLQSLPVHSTYLLWLSETGVIGAIGWIVFLAWIGIRCFRAMRIGPDQLGRVFAIGFLAGASALYVGDIASFTSKIDPVMQAFMILAGATIALGVRRNSFTQLNTEGTLKFTPRTGENETWR